MTYLYLYLIYSILYYKLYLFYYHNGDMGVIIVIEENDLVSLLNGISIFMGYLMSKLLL